MKLFRKIICTALIVALIATVMLTAFADTMTLYMRGKDNGTTFYESVEVQDVTKDTKITAIKSSDKTVMKVMSLRRSTYTNKDMDTGKSTKSYGATISVNLKKLGSATLTYKQDGKSKSQKFVVKSYTNPVSSFVLTGISNKNLKSRFDKHGLADALQLTRNASAGQLKVTAASGWVITSISWNDTNKNHDHSFYCYNGVSSYALNVPKMTKDGRYYITVDLKNKKTGGSQYVSLSVGQ